MRLAQAGRKLKVDEGWIAAVARADDLPVITQDADLEVIEALGGPAVIRV